jgi:TPR repeat protein
MAKVTDNADHSVRVVADGYMAPEGNTTEYSFPVDCYAYGMVLYELFSKQPLPHGPKPKPDLSQLPNAIQGLIKSTTREKAGDRRTFAQVVHKCDHTRGAVLVDSEEDPAGSAAALQLFREYRQVLDEREAEMAKDRLRGQAKGLRELFQFPTVSPPVLSELYGAADLGDFSAQIATGFVYLTGNAGTKSIFQAVADIHENRHVPYADFLARLWEAERENTFARAGLGEIGGNLGEAALAYRELALAGDREAALRYAALLLIGGKEKQGVALLERFAREGSFEANYTLGDYFLRWKKDEEAALPYFQAIAPIPMRADIARNPYPYMAAAFIKAKQGQWDEVGNYAEEVEQFDIDASAEIGWVVKSTFSRFAKAIKEAKPKVTRKGPPQSSPMGRGGARPPRGRT